VPGPCRTSDKVAPRPRRRWPYAPAARMRYTLERPLAHWVSGYCANASKSRLSQNRRNCCPNRWTGTPVVGITISLFSCTPAETQAYLQHLAQGRPGFRLRRRIGCGRCRSPGLKGVPHRPRRLIRLYCWFRSGRRTRRKRPRDRGEEGLPKGDDRRIFAWVCRFIPTFVDNKALLL
jgi:hypothetical protein